MSQLESGIALSADSSDIDTKIEVINKLSPNGSGDINKSTSTLRLYKSVPRDKIPLKLFQRIPIDMTREFNMGNLPGLANLINKVTHGRSLFRLQNPINTVEFLGVDSIISFFGNLLEAYPDAIILTKKVRSFSRAQFLVIEEKVEFTGTQFSKDLSRSLLNQHGQSSSKYQADYMTVSEEERIKFKALEDEVARNGRSLQIFNKAIMNYYIDPAANRIVLTDLKHKVINLRAV